LAIEPKEEKKNKCISDNSTATRYKEHQLQINGPTARAIERRSVALGSGLNF
jgi:hypothetical protein